MTVEEMLVEKQQRGYSYAQIAEKSGLPLGTVQKVLGGIVKNPRFQTLQALESAFGDFKNKRTNKKASSYPQGDATAAALEDSGGGYTYGSAAPGEMSDITYDENNIPTFKKQGEFTIEDYLALPEDKRYELIDGVLFYMWAPTSIHQIIANTFCYIVMRFIDKKKGSCIPVTSPIDVKLDEDNRTMVQPDFLIICDRDKIKKERIYGAPDFIVEVLSPSTKKKDTIIKLHKYAAAGVKEYWLIDPDKKMVVTYDFTLEEMIPQIYGFEAVIPVALYQGKLKIDMNEVWDHISFLYD